MPEVHHPLSPSSLHRRELCPGSFRMEKDLPSFETESAAEGTFLHEETAKKIYEYVKTNSYSPHEEERVNKAVEYFISVLETCGSIREVYIEQKVEYKYCGITQYYGHSDIIIVDDERVIIIDWKFGHREVESAPKNSQGAAYALGAMKQYQREVAEVHFYNPSIGQQTKHTFSDKNILAEYILNILNKCLDENAPIIAGEEQCRYCKAMYHGTCPAISKTAAVAVKEAENVIPIPALSVLSVDELCQMKDRCDLIAKLSERVDAEIKRRCEENGECGEWFLKESSGGREIQDIQGAFSASNMDADNFLKCCTVSVAKLEKCFAKTLKENGQCKTEKEGKEKFSETVGLFVLQKPNKKTLMKKSKDHGKRIS